MASHLWTAARGRHPDWQHQRPAVGAKIGIEPVKAGPDSTGLVMTSVMTNSGFIMIHHVFHDFS